MFKRHLALLSLAALVVAAPVWGQSIVTTSGPKIFVSTFTGGQILSVDGTTGAVSVVQTRVVDSGSPFIPEDIVVGPDKKVYICNPDGDQIWRMDLNGANFEKIFDHLDNVETLPTGPEGPSFHGSGDLFFNTRGGEGAGHSGVWMIPGIATVPTGGSFPSPVHVLTAAQTGSTFGEGTAFATNGDLLVVDRSNNRVLRLSPPYNGTPSVLINSTHLDQPLGIAVNSAGDIFVASSGATQKNVNRYNSAGVFQGTYATFVDGEVTQNPAYLEFAGAGKLYVATTATTTAHGGRVWRVDPPGGSANTHLLVRLADDLCVEGPSCVPALRDDTVVGLGASPAPVSITQHFDANNTSQLYNFGSDTARLSFPGGVLTSFDLTYTRTDVAPKDFNNELFPPDPPAFTTGTTCLHYSGDSGYCAVYSATGNIGGNPGGLPKQGTDYNGKYRVKIAFFSDDAVQNPGMAHEHEGSAFYDENMLIFFSPSATPGTDPAGQGETDGFSKIAMVNTPLAQNGNFCGFDRPLNINGRTFEAGRVIDVEFRLTTGLSCTGSVITDAIAKLSLVRLTTGGSLFVNVRSAGNEQKGNIFKFQSGEGRYEFDLSTRRLKAGTYALTVFSNKFVPQTVFFKIKRDDDANDDED